MSGFLLAVLWEVFGNCRNYSVLEGHKNAVLDAHWSTDGNSIYSCSADKTVAIWDAEVGSRRRKFNGHGKWVHACSALRQGPELLASASEDQTVKVWDARQRAPVHSLPHSYPVTGVAFGHDGSSVYTGGLDETIRRWDLRSMEVTLELHAHEHMISSLSLSPEGTHLLSHGMDGAIRCWDIQPYAPGDRCVREFRGPSHGQDMQLLGCAWSASGERVAGGSADRHSYVWDYESGEVLYRLPGHQGTVVRTVFHPQQPIIGSCGLDHTIFVGELDAED